VSKKPAPPKRLDPARQTASALALLLVATTLSGCASRNQVPNPFDGSSSAASGAEDPIRIDIQNLNFNDVTVWAMRQGQRVRLGRVTGKTDETFRIDWNLAIPISFVIDVTGGRACQTGQVGVERDGIVWVSVPANVGTQPCYAGRR
jgi:hypothetical protein